MIFLFLHLYLHLILIIVWANRIRFLWHFLRMFLNRYLHFPDPVIENTEHVELYMTLILFNHFPKIDEPRILSDHVIRHDVYIRIELLNLNSSELIEAPKLITRYPQSGTAICDIGGDLFVVDCSWPILRIYI